MSSLHGKTASLHGKTAFVAGGSRGIGAAIVRRLTADGARVAFTFLKSPERAADLVAEVEADGGAALAIQADSASPQALAGAIDKAAERFGRIDILVNSAGVLVIGEVGDLPLEDFDRSFAVNVRAPFVAVQAALPHMSEGGRVIMIGSNAAERAGFPGTAVYSATKGAVASMTRGLARDLGPRGITVNNIQPGPTATDMNPGDGPLVSMLLPMIPVGRYGRDDEVAGLVAYLAGPESGFVNGASLTIDGGFVS